MGVSVCFWTSKVRPTFSKYIVYFILAIVRRHSSCIRCLPFEFQSTTQYELLTNCSFDWRNCLARVIVVLQVVINWRDFDWNLYEEATSKHLRDIYEKWITNNSDDVEVIAGELSDCIQLSVESVATKKVISNHSRPYINSDVSEQLKLLRRTKRKCRYRKSPANVALLRKVQHDTIDIICKAKEEWWSAECQKLYDAPEKQKWKIIDHLTNQSQRSGLQPVKRLVNGEAVYLFDDDDILHNLRNIISVKMKSAVSMIVLILSYYLSLPTLHILPRLVLEVTL